MRTLPLDAETFKTHCMAVIEVVEDIDFQSKSQKVAKTGEPVWKVRLLTRDGDDHSRRPEVTDVKVNGHQRPEITPGVVPTFGGLIGIVWSGDSGGGVSLRADTVAMTAPPSQRSKAAATEKSAA